MEADYMPHQESIVQLKQAIKVWEHEFQRSNKRIPSRHDIKLDPKICKLYKAYKILKSKKTGTVPKILEIDTIERGTVGIDVSVVESQSDVEDTEEFGNLGTEHGTSQLKTKDTELGPTPQANGKVLSILDIRLTPPESSPLKSKTGAPADTKSLDIPQDITFKTPTKSRVNRIDFLQLTPRNNTGSRSSTLFQKLEQAAHVKSVSTENQIRTPSKNKEPLLKALETPQYLAKINNKFNFNIDNETLEGDIAEENTSLMSPSKPFPTSSILNPITPTKLAIPLNFQVSPSPLKPHRLFSYGNNKKLSEIFNDYKNINADHEQNDNDEYDEINDEGEIESQADDKPDNNPLATGPRKKKTTQKRTTRRWKMKPNVEESKEDSLKITNIHDEIKRINDEERKNLVEYMEINNSPEEEEPSSDEEYIHQKQDVSSMKGKVAPVRMNYQRLKINDPRIKKFKKRMQNRR